VIGNYDVYDEGSADMYHKGSNMIHTIRQLIDNDSVFRIILNTLNREYKHRTISSMEAEKLIIGISGKRLEKVFDQYLRTTQIPALEYRIIKQEKGNELLYRWTNCIEGFDMSIKLPQTLYHNQWIQPSTDWQSISVSLPEEVNLASIWDSNFYIAYKEVIQ
jgi:hypothetical protein